MPEAVVQSETSTANERLTACVEQILSKPDFPAFSQQIEETLQILNDKDVSANRLGVVVLRNYGLTLKVLQAANSFGANRMGAPILSVTQAIFRLGVDRVRALASGMVFFEHFSAKSGHAKQLVVLSLATATQADAVAIHLGHPRPEQAYLCGMLRNMGEILIASYFPDHFESICAVVARPNTTLPEVCRAALGFTYEELGVEMARRWRMPAEVSESIVAAPLTSPREALLVTITELAHGLTTVMYRGDAAEAQTRVTLLVQKLGGPLGLSKGVLEDVVKTAAEEARQVFARLKLPSHDFAVLDKARAANAFGKSVPAGARRPPTPATAASVRIGAASPALFAQLEREVDALSSGDPQAMILMVLETLQRGAGFDRVLLALAGADGRTIQGHVAIGAGSEALKKYFSFQIGTAGGPLGIALSRQQELVLRSDWELQPQEIAQLQYLGARMLGVLPLCADGALLGCLYYDRVNSAEPPSPSIEEGLRRLRDRTVQILVNQR